MTHSITTPACEPKKKASPHPLAATIFVVFICIASVYSWFLPLGEVSDETSHFALVRFIAEQGRPPLTNQERQDVGVKGDASPFYHGMVALFTQHVDVSMLPELPKAVDRQERLIPSDGWDNNRVFFHTENELPPYRGIVLAWHLARLVSIPLGLATLVAIYVTALAVFPGRPYLAVTAVVLAAFVPRFVTQSGVLNDDNLATPLATFAVYCLVRLVQGDCSHRRLMILGLLMASAALAKYHCLILLVEVTLVFCLLAWREEWSWRAGVARLLWVMIPFFALSGWWFVFLIARFNQVAELGPIQGLLSTLGDPVITSGLSDFAGLQPIGPDPSVENALSFPAWAWMTFQTFWIVYGHWGAAMAPSLVYVSLAVPALFAWVSLICITVSAHRQPSIAKFSQKNDLPETTSEQPSWCGLAVLSLHLALYVGLALLRRHFHPDLSTAQGRHLYPAIISISLLSALGLALSLRWLSAQLGHRHQAPKRLIDLDRAMALSLTVVLLTLAVVTPSAFLLPSFLPYAPVRSLSLRDTFVRYPLTANFGPGLELIGYDADPGPIRAGDALGITLFWQTSVKPDTAYLTQVCLIDAIGEATTCRLGVPGDGRYPMPAWEPGYIIRDRLFLPTPSCLASGQYKLSVSLLPLLADTPVTTVTTQTTAFTLGAIIIQESKDQSSANHQLWLGANSLKPGISEIKQLRQTLTLLTAYESPATALSAVGIAFLPSTLSQAIEMESTVASQPDTWLPVQNTYATPTVYACPNGTAVRSDSFIVHPAVQPGEYSIDLPSSSPTAATLMIKTRERRFDAPTSIPNRLLANFSGQILMMGYDIDYNQAAPGVAIPVTAYWYSLVQQKYGLIEALYLLDSSNMEIVARSEWALGGHYPNMLWAPGETVIEERVLQTTPDMAPGLYQIELSLYGFMTFEDGSTSAPIYVPITQGEDQPQVQKLSLGSVRLLDRLNGVPPTSSLTARLGESIDLIGFDIEPRRLQPGSYLTAVLHWSAVDQPSGAYTVFTQLIGPDGQIWAQQDSQPQAGRYPTSVWQAGDNVIDRYQLTLPEDAPCGEYHLSTGMYDSVSGVRLSATSDGQPLPDNAIPLAMLSID